jgi:hypothetical protein
MAERTILVCDMCDAPAVTTMKVTVKGRNYETDRCAPHLAEEMALMRPTKRGRKKATLAS